MTAIGGKYDVSETSTLLHTDCKHQAVNGECSECTLLFSVSVMVTF
jgi:hypothetical protein